MSAIHIEPLQAQHSDAVLELASNPLISKTSGVPENCDANTVNTWVSHNQLAAKELTFAIKVDGKIAGCCTLKKIDAQTKKAELSYWLGVDFWGKGITTQAAALLCDYAFETLQLHRLESHFLKNNNKASGKVLTKLGFVADTTRADMPVEDRYLVFAPDAWTFVVLPRTLWKKHKQGIAVTHHHHVSADVPTQAVL